MKQVWHWLRLNAWPVAATLASVVLGLMFLRGRQERLSLRAKLAVERERALIAERLSERAKLIESADAREPEIARIESEIDASKRRVLELHAQPIPETAEDLADAFARLGY